jgi:integrase
MIIKSCSFYYKHSGRHKNAAVLIHVRVPGYRVISTGTGMRANPDQWDLVNQRFFPNHPDHTVYNMRLEILRNNFKAFELTYLQRGVCLTPNDLKDFFMEITRAKAPYTLQGFTMYVASQKKTTGTYRIYKVVCSHISKCFREDVSFNQINMNFIHRFVRYLDNEHILSISRYNILSKLRSVIKEAENYELIRKGQNPFNYYKLPPRTHKVRPYLDAEELRVLLTLQPETPQEELCMDKWWFAVFTGMRKGDIESLLISEIKFKINEVNVEKITQKGRKAMKLNLNLMFNGKATDILNKYYNIKNLKVFPDHEHDDMEALLARFRSVIPEKHITFHTSRHSIAHLVSEATSDPYIVKELLCHSSITTSMAYSHLRDQHFSTQLKRVKL